MLSICCSGLGSLLAIAVIAASKSRFKFSSVFNSLRWHQVNLGIAAPM